LFGWAAKARCLSIDVVGMIVEYTAIAARVAITARPDILITFFLLFIFVITVTSWLDKISTGTLHP